VDPGIVLDLGMYVEDEAAEDAVGIQGKASRLVDR